jgi:hypothetical protein
MTKIAIIAATFLSIGTVSGEKAPAQDAPKSAFPMVRNIGIAERGDAIVVRERTAETKRQQK